MASPRDYFGKMTLVSGTFTIDDAFGEAQPRSGLNPNDNSVPENQDQRESGQSHGHTSEGTRTESWQIRHSANVEEGEKQIQQPHIEAREASHCTEMRSDETDNAEESVRHLQGWRLHALLLGICLAVFIVSIDRTVITSAIPFITRRFQSTSDIGWYGSSYLITASVFQLVYGRIYHMFSEKWSYLTALAIFEIGSLICGLAQSSTTLIIGRAISGFGSAGILTGSFVIVASVVPLQKRPVYTALVGVMFGVGATVGPLFGGIFTDLLTWRWCFFINLPLGGVTIIAFFFCYPSRNGAQHDSPLRDKIISLDLIGTLILLSSAIMLFFALEFINTGEPWDSARIIGLLCGFGVTAVLFGVWLWWKQDAALIPPAILCQRTVAASCTMGFMIYGALLVHAYFLPIWFQGVLGTSALQSGVNMIPYFLANAISSVVAGAFVSRIGYYVPPCLAGNAIATVGCGLLTMLSPSTSTAQWVGFEIIVALGFGLSIQQGFTAVQTVLPANRVAIGTAAVVACQSLGGSIFISAGTTIFQGHLSKAVAGYKIPGVDAKTVIAAGATVFRESVPSEYLPAILREYNEALRKVFVSVIPLAGLSLVCSLFFEWKSVRGTKAT